LPAVSAHDAAGVNASLVGLAQAFQQHRSAIDRVVTDANAFNAQTEASASALLSFSRYALVAVFVLSIVVSVMVYQAISGRLVRDVQALTRHISRFAEGNLSVPVTLDRGDELGAMAQGIEHTRAALASLVGSLRQQSNQIVASSSVLSGAALAIDVGAQEQADSANSMAAAVEELGASITEIGNSARRVRDLSQGVGARSLESDKAIEQMVAQIHEVSSRVRASAGDVKVLSETGESILRIVTVISEIADQTNLLALNAAIEAARAGDQGRGFAVVADEVRQLASRTAASTQEINAMIGAMHAATGKAVESITKGSEYAQLTVSSAESAKNALQETVGDIETLVTDIAQISGALLEQRSASEQIGSNVESTARATEKHGFAIKDIAATSTNLDEMAKRLAQSVARFST
jgi:methyl-accepting chemotaxis protein